MLFNQLQSHLGKNPYIPHKQSQMQESKSRVLFIYGKYRFADAKTFPDNLKNHLGEMKIFSC